ncbi:hypothetical protein VNO77_19971 [Canavalia gladiata]|uniref:Uncharacterized protein n=1 Tax=Canavalia gladiata TaxID=3824 RepID=A0AAN9LNL3_CANGL
MENSRLTYVGLLIRVPQRLRQSSFLLPSLNEDSLEPCSCSTFGGENLRCPSEPLRLEQRLELLLYRPLILIKKWKNGINKLLASHTNGLFNLAVCIGVARLLSEPTASNSNLRCPIHYTSLGPEGALWLQNLVGVLLGLARHLPSRLKPNALMDSSLRSCWLIGLRLHC